MEIPELVQEHLGDEELQTGVKLGDEDVICLTPTRTLLYRAEGLLSDEKVTEFPHELERLDMKKGRRKTTFLFEYVEGEGSMSVPKNLTRDVLEILLQGVLTTERILDEDEDVVGAFRFSELTLVVGERRVVKHVGNSVWEEDFEMFAYEDLTRLDFEKASVATEIVLGIQGRPQRIKTPNDEARLVERTLKKAVFEFFDVTTMSELQDLLEPEDDEADEETSGTPEDLQFGSEIKPLGDQSGDEGPFSESEHSEPDAITDAEAEQESAAPGTEPETESNPDQAAEPSSANTFGEAENPDPELAAIDEQLSELTTAVNKQNELLRKQHGAIKQLIEELRNGR